MLDVTGTTGTDVVAYDADAWVLSLPTNQEDCEEDTGWRIRLYGCNGSSCTSLGLHTWSGSWSGSECQWNGASFTVLENVSYDRIRMAGNATLVSDKVDVRLRVGVRCTGC